MRALSKMNIWTDITHKVFQSIQYVLRWRENWRFRGSRRPFCDRIPYYPTTYLTDWQTFNAITIQSIISNNIRILNYPRCAVVDLLWRKMPLCFRLQSEFLGRIVVISQQILDATKGFGSILCSIKNLRQYSHTKSFMLHHGWFVLVTSIPLNLKWHVKYCTSVRRWKLAVVA